MKTDWITVEIKNFEIPVDILLDAGLDVILRSGHPNTANVHGFPGEIKGCVAGKTFIVREFKIDDIDAFWQNGFFNILHETSGTLIGRYRTPDVSEKDWVFLEIKNGSINGSAVEYL